ncbi:helix-turn-helix domain-containing protein [Alicyclobacillus dauci]|uniref:Helix-turn-helix transcriptional regulator n=1 Tax=Alicyclobacillus dauci TaxID=1475485 RepID=A0ABY6Z9D9_9BACL|nr:helix-turn-helix transcriptional regulator [Alicyclobacillus dauci]WAH39510.1 helix-turn-helix transcriptional regulator [Alicyclobacillus dauci]WAH39570.1 helix-turn-helix transcriptional regulator [Alicyclobacillus dauci]
MIRLELQRILDKQGLTQTALAETSGVRQARISHICRGYVERLELKHIDAICKALDVEPWEWIMYEKD